MFWFFGHEACGILAPRPRIEPTPLALKGKVLTTGPPGKSLNNYFKYKRNKFSNQKTQSVVKWIKKKQNKKNKIHLYIAYKRLISVLRTHID